MDFLFFALGCSLLLLLQEALAIFNWAPMYNCCSCSLNKFVLINKPTIYKHLRQWTKKINYTEKSFPLWNSFLSSQNVLVQHTHNTFNTSCFQANHHNWQTWLLENAWHCGASLTNSYMHMTVIRMRHNLGPQKSHKIHTRVHRNCAWLKYTSMLHTGWSSTGWRSWKWHGQMTAF